MKFSAAVIVLFVVSACQGGIKKAAAPNDLIERDSMVVVLHDLVILESYVESRYNQVQNFHKIMSSTGKACLKGYRISQKRFERSFEYYAAHQEDLQGIYSEVLEQLNKEVNEMKAGGVKADSTAVLKPDLNRPFPGNPG